MTIKRIWHGYTTPERADEYEALLRQEVSVGIEAMKLGGLRRFDMLRRPAGDEVEFVTIMEFDDIDAVKAFVGEDYEQCYVPAEARAILSRFDERSQHYELLESRSYGPESTPIASAAAPAVPTSQPVMVEAVGPSVVHEPLFVEIPSTAAPVSEPIAVETTVPQSPAAQPAYEPQPLLHPDTWFVKNNRGNGSVPVTRKGYKVRTHFVYAMLVWMIAALALVFAGHWQSQQVLILAALPVLVVGTLVSAWYFIAKARRHTDYSMTYSDYLRLRKAHA